MDWSVVTKMSFCPYLSLMDWSIEIIMSPCPYVSLMDWSIETLHAWPGSSLLWPFWLVDWLGYPPHVALNIPMKNAFPGDQSLPCTPSGRSFPSRHQFRLRVAKTFVPIEVFRFILVASRRCPHIVVPLESMSSVRIVVWWRGERTGKFIIVIPLFLYMVVVLLNLSEVLTSGKWAAQAGRLAQLLFHLK